MKKLVTILMICTALAGCATHPVTHGPAQQVRLPSAPPPGEPSGTTGLHESELRAAFGVPALVRHDGTAQIWRFDAPGCRAFFFLYSRDGNTAVWHVETTPRGVNIAADENCLSALRARAAARPVS
ncbi:MAG: hypothetical protein ACXWKS_03055 [Rhizomicrobium sp.]